MAGEALRGLRVVEVGGGTALGCCGRQFALWGADVVLLEPASGSPLRLREPCVGGVSLLWEYLAAGKRTLAQPSPEALADLLARADILITDDPGQIEALTGRSLAEFQAAMPDLTVVSISPFGPGSPFAGQPVSELTLQALSGYISYNGLPDRPPLRAPGHILAYASGVNAFVAALAAVIARLGGASGQRIDVSELESLASLLPYLRVEYTGIDPRREGGPGTGVRIYPCRDGYVSFVAPMQPPMRPIYGEVLGIGEDEWPRFAADAPRLERRDALLALLAGRTADKTVDEIFYGLLTRGVVCGRVAAPRAILADEHLSARGFFQTLRHRTLGDLAMPGAPAHLSATPAVALAPAPAQADAVRAPARGWTGPAVLPPGRASEQPPLSGVRILDVTQAWIGPFAAMLLADLGAEVIKVESHLRPDVWRQYSANPVPLAHVRAEEINGSPNYNAVNRNKRSLCLDLKQPAGRDLFLRLAETADVVMENYTPRVMEKFGLGQGALLARNPRLVAVSFSGFGKTGPLSDFKASGASIEAIAGWGHFHRYPDQAPVVMGFYQPDPITGLQMAAAALVALVHQRRTGEGQAIDGSMYEAASGFIGEMLLAAQVGDEPGPIGNRDRDEVPSGVYPCRGEDSWLALSVPDDAAWTRLAELIPGLADAALADLCIRVARHNEIDAAICAWTAASPADAAAAALQEAGIPAARVRTLGEAVDSPHLGAWFRPNVHVDLGQHRYNGHASRFAGIGRGRDLPAPRLGEHSREILRREFGLSDGEIAVLMARDVTGEVLAKAAAPAHPDG